MAQAGAEGQRVRRQAGHRGARVLDARARPGAAKARTEPEPATILVRGLSARTLIGIRPEERTKRQDVVIDLELDVATRAGRSDRIEDAVDYKAVKDAVLAYVEGTQHGLLEALAQGIADLCLAQPGVQAVEVSVDKPGALRFARSVAVRMRRARPSSAAPAASAASGASSRRPRNWGHRG